MLDYYVSLQIPETSTPEEIRTAYKRLALKWHPDKNKSPKASEKFIEIKEAYEILREPIKRERYNQLLRFYRNSKPGQQKSTLANEMTRKEPGEGINDFDKIYEQFRKWKDEAAMEAVKQKSMQFNEFAKSIGATIGKGVNVIWQLLIYILFFAWGPVPIFNMLREFISDPQSFYRLSLLRWVGLLTIFLVCLGITALLVLVALNDMKKLNSESE